MKMAKASAKDIAAVREFLQIIDEAVEYGTFTVQTGEGDEEQLDCDDEMLASLIRNKWLHVGPAWQRVVYGCDVLISNCCDPALSHLEWRPDVKAFLDSQKASDT